ncbi:MAG: RsmE family RNA methyltransferase [Acidimicrobiales bacterium]
MAGEAPERPDEPDSLRVPDLEPPLTPARAPASAQVFVADLEGLVLADDDAHHLSRVLRLRRGEGVIASDGDGRWRLCRFSGAGETALEPAGEVLVVPPPSRPVTVAFTPVKGDRPEWTVQKLTELGVDRILVLHTSRSVVRWGGERGQHAIDRLRRIAKEAASQSRRARLPAVQGVMGLADAEAALAPVPLYLADPGGVSLGQVPAEVGLAVGPEGGWDDDERAGAAGRVGLGPFVLRAETAAVAAGALLCALRDDLVSAPPGPA